MNLATVKTADGVPVTELAGKVLRCKLGEKFETIRGATLTHDIMKGTVKLSGLVGPEVSPANGRDGGKFMTFDAIDCYAAPQDIPSAE